MKSKNLQIIALCGYLSVLVLGSACVASGNVSYAQDDLNGGSGPDSDPDPNPDPDTASNSGSSVGSGSVPSAGATSDGGTGAPKASPDPLQPQNPNIAGSGNFIPVAPKAYIGKLKTLLTGLAPNDSEITLGSTDTGLASLIDTWLQTPAADAALLGFFTLAFQQQDQSPNENIYDARPPVRLQQATREMMGRTALDVVKRDAPFNTLMNTRTYMMNTPLLAQMLYGESRQYHDYDNGIGDVFPAGLPSDINMKLKLTGGPIDPNKSADPKDPLFLTFYTPNITDNTKPNCISNNTLTMHKDNTWNAFNNLVWSVLQGKGGDVNWYVPPDTFSSKFGADYCSYNADNPQFTDADYTNWRPVTLRLAASGEAPDEFWMLPKLRTATTIKTRSPHAGFFSTTQFWGAYPSNAGNQMRAMANQTMIVALGKTFNGTDPTIPSRLDALDSVHASPTSTCFGCHRQMDPMRQFFMHDYSQTFTIQNKANMKAIPGVWVKDGVSQVGSSIYDFADKLAAQPEVAMAWTRKTCAWINSGPCLSTDPEVQRIAALFSSSNYNFRTMLKALLVSPMTTAKSASATNDELGVVVTMARKQQFCRTLSARLNINDICALKADTVNTGSLADMQTALAVLPTDSYSRGVAESTVVSNFNLLQRTGLEVVCAYVASTVVDSGSGALFASTDPNKAIKAIAQNFMGIPTARSTPYESILKQHYTSSLNTSGASATAALRSAFVVACLSPQIAMLGQY